MSTSFCNIPDDEKLHRISVEENKNPSCVFYRFIFAELFIPKVLLPAPTPPLPPHPLPSHMVPGCSEHAQPQPVDNPTTSCSPGNPLTSFLLSPPLFAIRIVSPARLCFPPRLKE